MSKILLKPPFGAPVSTGAALGVVVDSDGYARIESRSVAAGLIAAGWTGPSTTNMTAPDPTLTVAVINGSAYSVSGGMAAIYGQDVQAALAAGWSVAGGAGAANTGGGVLLIQSGVPVGIAPSGTVAANGALTLTTALVTTYSGGVYLYFPAGAVTGGAGFYWCVMSTTTAGQVYTATYTAGMPAIPTTLTPATGSNTAYSSTASLQANNIGINATLPGGVLGSNGILRFEWTYSHAGATGSSVLNLYLGTTVFYGSGNGLITPGAMINSTFDVYNRGSQSIQGAMRDQSSAAGVSGNVASANLVVQSGAVNTALPQTVCLNPWITASGDGVVMEKARILYFPTTP